MQKKLIFALLGAAAASCAVACCLNANSIKATYCKEEVVEKESATQELMLETETEAKKEENLANPIGITTDIESMKTRYLINEQLDPSGLIVWLNHDDGTTKELMMDDYEISDVETSSYGEKEVVVKYGDFSSSFMINVIFTVEACEEKTMYSTTSLSIRKGPDTSFDSIGTFELNEKVKVIGTCDNGSSQVDYQGEDAYASTKY